MEKFDSIFIQVYLFFIRTITYFRLLRNKNMCNIMYNAEKKRKIMYRRTRRRNIKCLFNLRELNDVTRSPSQRSINDTRTRFTDFGYESVFMLSDEKSLQ